MEHRRGRGPRCGLGHRRPVPRCEGPSWGAGRRDASTRETSERADGSWWAGEGATPRGGGSEGSELGTPDCAGLRSAGSARRRPAAAVGGPSVQGTQGRDPRRARDRRVTSAHAPRLPASCRFISRVIFSKSAIFKYMFKNPRTLDAIPGSPLGPGGPMSPESPFSPEKEKRG